tara:strand:- start:1310 stop:2536 length:1227 start_codon:yes stop_codon:yes gene_type:complete
MKHYKQLNNLSLYHGNNIDVLKQMESESVDCVVTSPPYWGLRDYGTATWTGGNVNCDHKSRDTKRGVNSPKQLSQNNGEGAGLYQVCPKCGAARTDLQLGLEPTPKEYVDNLVKVFQGVHRVLKPSGTVWLNLGDSYYNYRPGGTSQVKQTVAKNNGAVVNYSGKRNNVIEGLKEKDLVGIPWRVAFALQADGWYLRSDIIWQKPNPMPESVKDRPTKSHEYIFLLTKSKKYYYDADAIKEPTVSQDKYKRDRDNSNHKFNNTPGRTKMSGLKDNKYTHKNKRDVWSIKEKNITGNMSDRGVTRTTEGLNMKSNAEKTGEYKNKRDVWSISTKPYKEAHFAVFPEEIPMNCIKAGSPKDGVVLDPFAGSGTTLKVALGLGRKAIGIDINTEYLDLCIKRCNEIQNILI